MGQGIGSRAYSNPRPRDLREASNRNFAWLRGKWIGADLVDYERS